MCVCVCKFMYIHVFVCIYTYTYIYMYIYICILGMLRLIFSTEKKQDIQEGGLSLKRFYATSFRRKGSYTSFKFFNVECFAQP
jgi:hypothetical protein